MGLYTLREQIIEMVYWNRRFVEGLCPSSAFCFVFSFSFVQFLFRSSMIFVSSFLLLASYDSHSEIYLSVPTYNYSFIT